MTALAVPDEAIDPPSDELPLVYVLFVALVGAALSGLTMVLFLSTMHAG